MGWIKGVPRGPRGHKTEGSGRHKGSGNKFKLGALSQQLADLKYNPLEKLVAALIRIEDTHPEKVAQLNIQLLAYIYPRKIEETIINNDTDQELLAKALKETREKLKLEREAIRQPVPAQLQMVPRETLGLLSKVE